MSITVLQWLDGLIMRECVFTSSSGGDWQGAPGRILRGPDGALALNFAPARWLLLSRHDHWTAPASAAGALLFDATGKWRLLQLPGSATALRAAVDLDSVLEVRDCAAAVLFDTPVIMARNGADALLVCVPASYAESFVSSIQNWS